MDDDVTPSLMPLPGIDIEDYKDTLVRRFSNPAIEDKVQRLAEDGSAKIPNAILPCIRHGLRTGGSIVFGCLALAAWFRYLTGRDEKGAPIEIKDPRKSRIMEFINGTRDEPVGVLGLTEIFGSDLIANDRLVRELTQAVDDVARRGVEYALVKRLARRRRD